MRSLRGRGCAELHFIGLKFAVRTLLRVYYDAVPNLEVFQIAFRIALHNFRFWRQRNRNQVVLCRLYGDAARVHRFQRSHDVLAAFMC